jgi:hypothetical protein
MCLDGNISDFAAYRHTSHTNLTKLKIHLTV